MTKPHSEASLGSRHPVHSFEFDDTTERDAYTYAATDIGKFVAVGTGASRTFYQIHNVASGVGAFTQMGATSAWVPSAEDIIDYSELKLWYDGDHTVLSGSAITQLLDRSSNGNDSVVQSTSTKRPSSVNTLNGLTTMTFDGGDCIQTPSISLTTFTIYCLFHDLTSLGLLYEQSANANSNSGIFLYPSDNDSARVNKSSTVSTKIVASNWGLNQDWPIIAVHQYGGTHASHRVWINNASNTPLTNGVNGTSDPGTAATNALFNIGARDNATSLGFTGRMAAFMVFSPRLNGFKQDAVARYLSQTYGNRYGGLV